jgi:SWI/SNF-related matrix-associated actin-dependent regulator of chromatin subfamily A containing DEAD/H box 1
MDSHDNDPIVETPQKYRQYTDDIVDDQLSNMHTASNVHTFKEASSPFFDITQYQNTSTDPSSYQQTQAYITQPTQLIERAVPDTPKRNDIQVPASSPIQRSSASPVGNRMQNQNGGYDIQSQQQRPVYNGYVNGQNALAFAPPGTFVRQPGAVHSQTQPYLAPGFASASRSALQKTQNHNPNQMLQNSQNLQSQNHSQQLNGYNSRPMYQNSHPQPQGLIHDPRALQGWQINGLRYSNPYPNMFSVQPGYQASISGHLSQPRRPPIIDLSDDEGMKYQGGFSEDESQHTRDIKPSMVKIRNYNAPYNIDAQNFSASRLADMISGSAYNGPQYISQNGLHTESRGIKRPADPLTSAYAGYDRPNKMQRQTQPSRVTQPSNTVASLEDVQDLAMRQRILRVQSILEKPVAEVYTALVATKGNEQDAMAYLLNPPPKTKIDLTGSDDELSMPQPRGPPKPSAKQQLKNPHRSIQERYGQTSSKIQIVQPPPEIKPQISNISLMHNTEPETTAPRRKRLMRGRKVVADDSDEEDTGEETPDSGVASDGEDSETQDDLLKFLNNCLVPEFMDLAQIPKEQAEHIISHRPFKNFEDIEQIREAGWKPNPKARKQARPMGERILEVSRSMWSGYQAVDILIQNCRKKSEPLTEGIKAWGVDVVGVASEGEVALMSLNGLKSKDDSSQRDSGLGTPTADDEDELPSKSAPNLLPQPEIMSKNITLKDYQLVGMNWLNLCFRKNISAILADDMGLGKTCQVIAFLAHLYETGVAGPHVIVVPSSVLENWCREFENFCPGLSFLAYSGSQQQRDELRRTMEKDKPYVVITTYSYASQKDDRKFLTRLEPTSCIFDEGHQLKAANTKRYKECMKIEPRWRLIMTGTPLQNNLQELVTLLAFLMPDVFSEQQEALESIFNHKAKTSDETHDALLSNQRITRARSMIAPFILRRKKHQVLSMVKKERRVEYCEMKEDQKKIYDEYIEMRKEILAERKAAKDSKTTPKPLSTTNFIMQLRKAAIHPLLFRRKYDDAKVNKISKIFLKNNESDWTVKELAEENSYFNDFALHRWCKSHDCLAKHTLQKDEWMDSGKVQKLVELVLKFKENGDRVLVFSQFRLVMDILEEVFETTNLKFYRIDGNTPVDDRQQMIDEYSENKDVTVFMLSTKAGGAGLNLMAANKVIIFDQSFNPQDDIQAENRAHRVGQTRDVEVIRLITKDSIEEQIFALGASKLELDAQVAGENTQQPYKGDKSALKKLADMLGIEEVEGGEEDKIKFE